MNSRTLTATTLAVAAAAGAGTVANLAQQPGWYARLRKPPYVPPDWVFPLAWTSLYTDIAATSAVAVDRLRTTGRQRALRRYIVALGAGVLTVSTADLARRTADVAPRAGYALLPYPLWCTFAFLLSVRIWLLNR